MHLQRLTSGKGRFELSGWQLNWLRNSTAVFLRSVTLFLPPDVHHLANEFHHTIFCKCARLSCFDIEPSSTLHCSSAAMMHRHHHVNSPIIGGRVFRIFHLVRQAQDYLLRNSQGLHRPCAFTGLPRGARSQPEMLCVTLFFSTT
jgi:hypothetical protein